MTKSGSHQISDAEVATGKSAGASLQEGSKKPCKEPRSVESKSKSPSLKFEEEPPQVSLPPDPGPAPKRQKPMKLKSDEQLRLMDVIEGRAVPKRLKQEQEKMDRDTLVTARLLSPDEEFAVTKPQGTKKGRAVDTSTSTSISATTTSISHTTTTEDSSSSRPSLSLGPPSRSEHSQPMLSGARTYTDGD